METLLYFLTLFALFLSAFTVAVIFGKKQLDGLFPPTGGPRKGILKTGDVVSVITEKAEEVAVIEKIECEENGRKTIVLRSI